MLLVDSLKQDFSILERRINGKVLTYLDNASTTQKPKLVLDALLKYYETMNANIHRGVHTLSEEATLAYENARAVTAKFVNARESEEIVFTRNATEAFNLVASTWCEQHVNEGDNIVVSALEHHSNLVPWQELCRRKKAELQIIPLAEDGTLDLNGLEKIITERTKIVAVTHMSNVLGTIVPLEKILQATHAVGAKIMVDAAQSVAHMSIDVQKLDVDFLAFSSHKIYGPTGVGVLYGKRELLEAMSPFLFGGEMVLEVKAREATFNRLPWKFEAGTPNIADTIALAKALEYVQKIGFEHILSHDWKLLQYARKKLATLPKLRLFGPKDVSQAAAIVSFTIEGVHPHDIGSILNEDGVAIRAGHHCAQPLMQILQVPATARMSFGLYNTEEDVDHAYEALQNVYKIFKL